jgi:hypothetical protein
LLSIRQLPITDEFIQPDPKYSGILDKDIGQLQLRFFGEKKCISDFKATLSKEFPVSLVFCATSVSTISSPITATTALFM